MAISTYGELKTAVANWPERTDMGNRIPEFISLAEDRIYSTIRIREMEASTTITTTAAQQTDPLPTRFLSLRRAYVDGSPDTTLEFRTPFNFWSVYGSQTTSSPQIFTIEGENFVWAPIPDAAYTISILYHQSLARFSADSDTNNILTKYRGLYLYGALLEAATWANEDSDIVKYAQLFDDSVARAEAADRMDRYSGSPPVLRDTIRTP